MKIFPTKQRLVTWGVWSLFGCTVVGGSLVAVVAVGSALSALFPDLCANEVIGRYPSPDGLLELVVFERDCGATTGFSTQASILDRGARLANEPGNLFDANDNRGAAPSGPGGGPEIRAHWIDVRTLSVSYHVRANLTSSSWSSAHGVRVKYSTFR